MFQCVQSGQPRLAEAALLVFAQLARYLADTLRQYLGTLHGVRPGHRAAPRASFNWTLGGGRSSAARVRPARPGAAWPRCARYGPRLAHPRAGAAGRLAGLRARADALCADLVIG